MWKKHREQLSFHIINGDYTYEETLNGEKSGIEDNYKLSLSRSFVEPVFAARADVYDVQRPRGDRQHRRRG